MLGDTYVPGMLFSPSGHSGRLLRSSLNMAVADGLLHLEDACKTHVRMPSGGVSALADRMQNGSRETPYLYALYFRIVEAIDEDRLVDIEDAFTKIVEAAPAADPILVTPLSHDKFPWDVDTVAHYFAAEADTPVRYTAPAEGEMQARKSQIADALDLLRATCPALAAELDELITTIIIAGAMQTGTGSGEETSFAFQGSSALRAFGAILKDDQPDLNVVDCAASLIHEEAHNVLFALSPKEGVVENPYDERFASPLRDDPRPMEGIFHAMFVLARMVFGLSEMIASGKLTPAQLDVAEVIRRECIPLFFDGLDTVHKHGVLTPQGAMAVSEAEGYMSAFR